LEVQEYFDSLTEDLVEVQLIDSNNEISGPQKVYPYENYHYTVDDTDGQFSIDDNSKARIINQNNGECEIEIISSKKGYFNLTYTINENTYTLLVTILSL
jgi:hypothetical protein